MGLFSFLTGKKAGASAPVSTAPGGDMIRVASPPPKVQAKAQAKAEPGAEAPPPAAAKAAGPAKAVGEASATGSVHVKLRMKLAAATRNGDLEEAYVAARDLETIQTKAGRRVAARVWREQAERIYEQM